MSGWTGWTDLDFSNTLFRAAAWRAAQPLPAEWNLSAAAALRDRVLSRLCLWLGFLCRGGGPESFDLTPAIRAMETLYPGCTRDPENKPSGHCWRKGEVIQWMRWAMERIDKD